MSEVIAEARVATGERSNLSGTMSGKVRLPVRLQQVLPLMTALGPAASSAALPFPLDRSWAVPTFSGTAAVYQAFRALGLPPGSIVLCPSYNCGHEIEPLLRLGLRVRCYRIGADMDADLDDIRRRMNEEVKAILVTHFFGFAQRLGELRALCDRWGAFLVEDCAHALLSDNVAGTLGRVGDAAVFSLRKTLPLPNGGAVLLNNPSLSLPQDLESPPWLTTWLKTVSLVKKSVLDGVGERPSSSSLALLAAVAPLAAANGIMRRFWPSGSPAGYDPDDEDFGFASRILGWRMPAFTMELMRRIDWRGIGASRRSNYRFLAERLETLPGCRVIRREVPEFTCPLFLPVVVDQRERLFTSLVRQGIHTAIWWDQRHPAVDWGRFPEATDLKDRVLALPVHQDLSCGQLEYVAAALRRSLVS